MNNIAIYGLIMVVITAVPLSIIIAELFEMPWTLLIGIIYGYLGYFLWYHLIRIMWKKWKHE